MALDLAKFASKLTRVRQMFDESHGALALATGIPEERLRQLEDASVAPSGDEVLIIADHFRVNFRFFISNESDLSVERAETLFRAHAKDLNTADRLAIQEFLTLCENEAFLLEQLKRPAAVDFRFTKHGGYYKGHGTAAAHKVREALGYSQASVPDVFGDIRKLGIHVFRRRLANPNISGLFILDDTAGPCVLVNYNEDVYRQRFTAAHEAAHAIFDAEDGYVVSFTKWDSKDLKEIRANTFAAEYLVSSELIAAIPQTAWSESRFTNLAEQLQVNSTVLALALQRGDRMSEEEADFYTKIRFSKGNKSDPELPSSLTSVSKQRKQRLLARGLSSFYVSLCIEALQAQLVSKARVAEMLLIDIEELGELLALFGLRTMP